MAVANQYGINLDNILSSASTLKSAKLRQEKLSNELAETEQSDLVQGNYLSKSDPRQVVQATDENEDGVIDATEKKNALRNTGRRYKSITKIKSDNQLRANRSAAAGRAAGRYKRQQEKYEKQEKRNQVMLNSQYRRELLDGMNIGKAKENKAMGIKNSKILSDNAAKMSSNEIKIAKNKINLEQKEVFEVISIGVKDAKAGEKAFQGKREQMRQNSVEVGKTSPETADEINAQLERYPVTLLNEDGTFNTKRATEYLTSLENKQQILENPRPKSTTTPTFSQLKGNERAAIKHAKEMLKDEHGIISKENKKVIDRVGDIVDKHPAWSATKILREAKRISKKTNTIKRGQKSRDGKQIFDGQKWITYTK